MNDIEQEHQAEVPAPAITPVVHEQPATGGSYTRDFATGALVKAEPAPQSDEQE